MCLSTLLRWQCGGAKDSSALGGDEGKATRGQGSTYRYRRAVRVDQLSGRVPLMEGLLDICLQKGDHGRERREGSRARVRGQRKGKKGKKKEKARLW